MSIQNTEFINVDMVLYSKEDLSPIADELAERALILQNAFYDGEYKLAFECAHEEYQSAVVIDTFIKLLDELSPQTKALLARCTKKMLDIGYNSGRAGIVYDHIRVGQLKKLFEYGLDLNVTIYPLEE